MPTRQQTQDAYRDGRIARMSGEKKSSVPFDRSELNLQHWWLGGWNDKDMELNK
tara:strand:+ start:337 stop:498 length:162 start_codon:yes stop_codon:yes gene_type:complete